MDQCAFHILLFISCYRYKSIFKRFILCIVPLQELEKVEQVCSIECTMYKGQEFLQVRILMLHDELVRCLIHPIEQAHTVIDDRSAVTPGQHRGKKPGDLNILFPCEAVRDR